LQVVVVLARLRLFLVVLSLTLVAEAVEHITVVRLGLVALVAVQMALLLTHAPPMQR
jgi:hypothetical protein